MKSRWSPVSFLVVDRRAVSDEASPFPLRGARPREIRQTAGRTSGTPPYISPSFSVPHRHCGNLHCRRVDRSGDRQFARDSSRFPSPAPVINHRRPRDRNKPAVPSSFFISQPSRVFHRRAKMHRRISCCRCPSNPSVSGKLPRNNPPQNRYHGDRGGPREREREREVGRGGEGEKKVSGILEAAGIRSVSLITRAATRRQLRARSRLGNSTRRRV